MKSKVDELLERLEKEGKLIHLSDDEITSIDRHIRADMEEFRAEMYRKQAQSEMDTAKIILNA